MAETRTQLAELCRDHAIGMELIEQSRDLEQVLDRTLAECERRIGSGGSNPDDRLRQLSGLVQLARTTRSLQSRGASLEDARDVERALVEVDRTLSNASVNAEKLQRRLDDAMVELDAVSPGPPIDRQLLNELFGSIARLCHKINNPLTSIMGRAQMLQLKVKQGPDEQLAKSVGVIEESSKRVADLVQELANLICQGRKKFAETYDSSNGSR